VRSLVLVAGGEDSRRGQIRASKLWLNGDVAEAFRDKVLLANALLVVE
jgi:hypothetical protein